MIYFIFSRTLNTGKNLLVFYFLAFDLNNELNFFKSGCCAKWDDQLWYYQAYSSNCDLLMGSKIGHYSVRQFTNTDYNMHDKKLFVCFFPKGWVAK